MSRAVEELAAKTPGKRSLAMESFAKVQGLGFTVQGSGFRVQGTGFRVCGLGVRVQGSGFRV